MSAPDRSRPISVGSARARRAARVGLVFLAIATVVACTGADDDGADPERVGGPTTTVDGSARVAAADLPAGSWSVGEIVCSEPPTDDGFEVAIADFVQPATVNPGETISVALDPERIAAALRRDPVDTEIETFGGDHVVLTCWEDDGWTPVWLVRLPGFAEPIADDEDGDVVDAGDVPQGSYRLGSAVEISGTEVFEPIDVSVEIPAEIPPGRYRWTKTVGLVGSGGRTTIVQAVEITPP